ncbi:hypothetical protein KJ865_16435, partial [Myxococcota bacterium]|nr:hypothetical protein [Myxococcota bacterium]
MRTVPPPRGPAAGIEFLVPSATPELVRLCDILRQNQELTPPPLKGKVTSAIARREVIAKAKELLDKAQYMDFYQTLDVTPDISMTAMNTRKDDLIVLYSVSTDGFTPEEVSILSESIALIKRLTGILSNPQRRLGYDLARGKASPAVVRECHKDFGVDLKAFREFWESKY